MVSDERGGGGEAAAIAGRVLNGDIRAAARLMRALDDGRSWAIGALRELFPHTGRAQVIGLTGSPGAGKSSLTNELIRFYRQQGKTVGVVAIDPTSPYTGGAILGDRIRMQDHSLDPGVFIRSLATRGNLGGLSRGTSDVIRVMDAMGKDVILVETVGVGQDEIDIASLAHTTIVVVVPGMGDDIQAIKAGILEVADVFAINKSDREGVDRIERELKSMLDLRDTVHHPGDHDAEHRFTEGPAPLTTDDPTWSPPIVRTIAVRSQGIDELGAAVAAHRDHLEKDGKLATREAVRARTEFLALLRDKVLASALLRIEREEGQLDELASRIARHEADPYALVEEVAKRLL